MNANGTLKRCPFCGGEAAMKRHFIGENRTRYILHYAVLATTRYYLNCKNYLTWV